MGEIIVSNLPYRPRPSRDFASFFGLAFFLGKQVDALVGRIGDVTGALPGLGKA
jgi:hypothetical protein